MISGGGGGPLDEWCTDFPETDVVALSHHYLTVEADCHLFAVTARDTASDELLDYVAIDG